MRANYVSDTVCKGCLYSLDWTTGLTFLPLKIILCPVIGLTCLYYCILRRSTALHYANASSLACKSLVNVLYIVTIEDNHSLVSCKLGFIPQLSLKHDHCCEANLPSLYDQSVYV